MKGWWMDSTWLEDPCKVEPSFKQSPLWGQSWSRNKMLRDNGNLFVNPSLRGEPWDSLFFATPWMIPALQGAHLCIYLAVSWSFFHKILRTQMNQATQRLIFYKGKNWLTYLLLFCKVVDVFSLGWQDFLASIGQEFWITSLTPPSFKMLSSGGLPTTHY